jgi:hypothetical protein
MPGMLLLLMLMHHPGTAAVAATVLNAMTASWSKVYHRAALQLLLLTSTLHMHVVHMLHMLHWRVLLLLQVLLPLLQLLLYLARPEGLARLQQLRLPSCTSITTKLPSAMHLLLRAAITAAATHAAMPSNAAATVAGAATAAAAALHAPMWCTC